MATFRFLVDGISKTIQLDFGCTDFEQCMRHLGILEDAEVLMEYEDLYPWRRGGAETYIAAARVQTNLKEKRFIAKALFSFATSPERQLQDWARRRAQLITLGIRTPILYSSCKGVIYEDFIEEEFNYSSLSEPAVVDQLVNIAATLDRNGYASLSFTKDIRIMDKLLYYVDFGFDLGEPTNEAKNNALDFLITQLGVEFYRKIESKYNELIHSK